MNRATLILVLMTTAPAFAGSSLEQDPYALIAQSASITQSAPIALPSPIEANAGSPGLGLKCAQKHKELEASLVKFKQMGVGVGPFQRQLDDAKSQLAEGRTAEANETLKRLEENLVDQQKRFYSNKWQSWHTGRKLLAQKRIGLRSSDLERSIKPSGKSSNKSSISSSITSKLSGKDTKYNPVIYAIAR